MMDTYVLLGSTSQWRRRAILSLGFKSVSLCSTLSDREERALEEGYEHASDPAMLTKYIAEAKMTYLRDKLSDSLLQIVLRDQKRVVLLTADQAIAACTDGTDTVLSKPHTVDKALEHFDMYRSGAVPRSVLAISCCLVEKQGEGQEGEWVCRWERTVVDEVPCTLDLDGVSEEDLRSLLATHPDTLQCCGSLLNEAMPFCHIEGETSSFEGLSHRLVLSLVTEAVTHAAGQV
ncbi:Maf-like protein [Kipferlia bialata]|uniref:Maf-like protein n=1 Tax=Kipferlia bialata TaxID=797122 RepID=A0A9K3CYD5_9EUKA|nr:Maf-like protein [Kipferlia bialata]|eukprot:g5987.t1